MSEEQRFLGGGAGGEQRERARGTTDGDGVGRAGGRGLADEGLRTRDRGGWVDGVSAAAAAAAAAAAGGASWMDEDAAWARDMVIEVTECWTLTSWLAALSTYTH
ncbi:hypothetical protein TEQG_07220 [Trichophyton equinum CBS 127.97]|uniref:Uncharacterized protein n=1 Tax=Trichophyton equinum (strain ATCC MYA-4606 / CBS 127.97) TaxID=559882 RepID=F2Q2C4_TRIEC|nr:hypothetical protein TEQG_07220 [Trichophyton equinum CBS 127.97]